MIKRFNPILALPFVAAHLNGAVTVVKHNPTPYVPVVAVLSTATAILFIVVLLSCGMRKPLL